MTTAAAAAAPKVSSSLPTAARKQVKDANRLIAELNAKPGDPPPGETPAGDPPPGDLPVVQIAAPPAGSVPAAPVEDTFKHKYNTLKGKYDREVAEANARAADTQAILNKVLTDAAMRQAAPAPAAPAAPVKPEDRFRAMGVTDKEVSDYGVELLDLMERMSNATSGTEIRRLQAEITQLKSNVGTVGNVMATDARQKVFDALFRDVGQQWVDINNSEEFLAWLRDVDVFSGTSKLDGLADAFKKHDAARVVAIFKAYIGKTPTGSTSQRPAVVAETLIAPGAARGGTGEAPGATGGKIWSEQEITDFYQRARKGKVPTDEYAATTAEISRAAAEGRIRVSRSTQHHINNG